MAFMILSLMVLSLLRQVTSVVPRADNHQKKPIAAAHFLPDSQTSLSDIPWAQLNKVIYSFAFTTPDVNYLDLSPVKTTALSDFVNEAHCNGVSAEIGVGGWTGSRYFSTNMGSPENRTAFVQTVAKLAGDNNLDGVQFDWEYPGKQGIGCNTISANDTDNFLLFLQELRQDEIGAKLTLSAATSVTTFMGPNGTPLVEVSNFAEVLDYIMIMDYDIWGSSSSSVGPNAPLNDTCAVPANQQGSAVSGVHAWTSWKDFGMPVEKVVLGVPGYGHSFSVSARDAFMSGSHTELAPYPAFNASSQPLGDSDTSRAGGINVCGAHEGPGGTFTFKGLVKNGFLTKEGKPAHGIFHRFDDCSQTPYVYNETSQVMVSYDDVRSFGAKGKYIKDAGLGGFAMWKVGDDYDNFLLSSIEAAAGMVEVNHYKRNCNL